jgi:muramoyltetrapeptide carboxypeptidase LdcA involved in peptidoglycan recycling
MEYFKRCIFADDSIDILPSDNWSDDWWLKDQTSRILQKNSGWEVVNEGYAKGVCLGGNLSTFNLLQGTEYFPNIKDSILFLEDDSESALGHFDRDLESLTHMPDFDSVKAIIIGRFQNKSEVDGNLLKKSLQAKKHIKSIPVVTNLDFGHTDPIFTFPIGGEVELHATVDSISLKILKH